MLILSVKNSDNTTEKTGVKAAFSNSCINHGRSNKIIVLDLIGDPNLRKLNSFTNFF